MHALRRAVHVLVRLARRVVPLVMFSRARQRRQIAVNGIIGRLGGFVHRVEGQRWRATERCAHHDDGAKHVRPDQRAPGRDRRAEIMPDDSVDAAIAERRHQPERVAHQVGEPERGEIAVVIRVPSGGAAIAALVRRDHVIAGGCENGHYLAPAKGQFGEAMQQQHAGPTGRLETGFEHVHAQAVDVFHVAGADGGGERDLGEDGHDTFLVMAGLVPAIHVLFGATVRTWMPGTSPGMTCRDLRAPDAAQRSCGALQSRGPSSSLCGRGFRLCGAALHAAPRPGQGRALRLRRLRPIFVAQMPLHQFPGRRARQFRLEVDALRALDRRQMFSAEHNQFGLELLAGF